MRSLACFPIFFAVIENDLRRVLAYSLNNQLGFMVCAIGIGSALALNGAEYVVNPSATVAGLSKYLWELEQPASAAANGVFIGATRSQEMRNTMLVATFGCYLPFWWLLSGWGNHGLWAALIVLMVVRAMTLGFWYPRIVRDLPV